MKAIKRSASVDIFWVTRHDRDSGEQTAWIKQNLLQRYVCVGCQLNNDQALRLFCSKGHFKARDSTLWWYYWQQASEFLCTEIPLFGGSWKTKKIALDIRKRFLRRATNIMFAKFRGWRSAKKYELVRINSGPKILRSCFLRCRRSHVRISCWRI